MGGPTNGEAAIDGGLWLSPTTLGLGFGVAEGSYGYQPSREGFGRQRFRGGDGLTGGEGRGGTVTG